VNPGAPVLVRMVDTPGNATAVGVHGSLALVTDSAAGVQVVDVSNPGPPSA
jgi:hypothetical protein